MKAKALRLHGANDLRLDEFELPEITDDEILVKVISDSVCMSTYKCAILGTDHKRVHSDVAEHPAIMGHEFAGEIVQVGKNHQDKFKPGMRFAQQPALNYKGTMWSPGYSYEFFGGDCTYCIIPAEVMELGCLMEYTGKAFYESSLAEPMSCCIGAFHASYHTKMGVYHHEMGIKEGGKLCRKLALDQRLMNPMLPDSESGKVAACADNVYSIWERTSAQRSTQMVFCDLSTPHNDGKFNVYDDLRTKLIAKGIPAEEIAYIHSAATEAQKKEMFGKVRSGQIRVLLGSTQKMGAGTNVQTKLIALHHIDCPWRPSDLQQREGRIVRQGNENAEVDICTYVTENTFDSYLYQLVESKQRFIGQVMTSKSPVRSAEDIDETALSYAEIKALCTGNPYIKEKMDLDIAVQRLRLLKSNHLSQKYYLEDRIYKEYPYKIAALEQRVEGFHADMAHRDSSTHKNEDGFSPMEIKGVTYTEKKAAGNAILACCQEMTSPDPIPLGKYRGFAMSLSFDSFAKAYVITMKNELTHTTHLGTDVFGNIQRLDNLLDFMGERLQDAENLLSNTKAQLESAKAEVAKSFPQEEELRTKTARLEELNVLLDMDKPENEIVDGDVVEEPTGQSTKAQER